MKPWFIFLLFFFSACFVQAQDISVVKFQKLENDLDARTNAPVLDYSGKKKCALIKVVTTEKGFSFDVGQLGVKKVVDTLPAEIWVYVPAKTNKIKIMHPKLGQIKSEDGYYRFPDGGVESATCYRMEITTNKIIEALYDDSRKQDLLINVRYENAAFFLNGVKIGLDSRGIAKQEVSFGTHKYKVEAPGYYPKEGKITINDSQRMQTLEIKDLKPIMGKIKVMVEPPDAKLYIDEKEIRNSIRFEPYELQIGIHNIRASANGYKTEIKTIEIEDTIKELKISLSRMATFTFDTDPSGAIVSVGGSFRGKTPCSTQLSTGTYRIKAEKSGYKDYDANVKLNSANPRFKIHLRKIYNKKYELYLEANSQIACWQRFMTVGATIGGFIYNVNIETAYFYGFGKSENIYWCGSNVYPIGVAYKPIHSGVLKVGYGFPLGTRFRIAPQFGLSFLELGEELKDKHNHSIANGAYAGNGIVAIRFSAVVVNHLALTVTPEYAFSIKNSHSYNLLSEVSSKIKRWEQGVSIKLGVAVFFQKRNN